MPIAPRHLTCSCFESSVDAEPQRLKRDMSHFAITLSGTEQERTDGDHNGSLLATPHENSKFFQRQRGRESTQPSSAHHQRPQKKNNSVTLRITLPDFSTSVPRPGGRNPLVPKGAGLGKRLLKHKRAASPFRRISLPGVLTSDVANRYHQTRASCQK